MRATITLHRFRVYNVATDQFSARLNRYAPLNWIEGQHGAEVIPDSDITIDDSLLDKDSLYAEDGWAFWAKLMPLNDARVQAIISQRIDRGPSSEGALPYSEIFPSEVTARVWCMRTPRPRGSTRSSGNSNGWPIYCKTREGAGPPVPRVLSLSSP